MNLADFRDLQSRSQRCGMVCSQSQLDCFSISLPPEIFIEIPGKYSAELPLTALIFLLTCFWTKWWHRSKHPSFSEKANTWIGGRNNFHNFLRKHSSKIFTKNKKIEKGTTFNIKSVFPTYLLQLYRHSCIYSRTNHCGFIRSAFHTVHSRTVSSSSTWSLQAHWFYFKPLLIKIKLSKCANICIANTVEQHSISYSVHFF